MTDNLQKIGWLPTTEEFEELLGEKLCVPKQVEISLNKNFPVEVTFPEKINTPPFSLSELGVLLGRYNEFRLLLLKFEKTSNTFVSFNLLADNTQILSSLLYTDEKGLIRRSNYARDSSDHWFTNDLLADLKRLTKDVPDTDETKQNVIKDVSDWVASRAIARTIVSTALEDAFSEIDKNVTDNESLKLSDFKIGDHFKFNEMEVLNRVTDIGTRTLAFIRLDQEDPRNYNGPPYSIVEHVLDEYDLEGIEKVDRE